MPRLFRYNVDGLNDALEAQWLRHGEIGQDAAVKEHVRAHHFVDNFVVADTVHPRASVNSLNPQAPHRSFLQFSANVCILPSFGHSLQSNGITVCPPSIPLCKLCQFLVPVVSHLANLLAERRRYHLPETSIKDIHNN